MKQWRPGQPASRSSSQEPQQSEASESVSYLRDLVGDVAYDRRLEVVCTKAFWKAIDDVWLRRSEREGLSWVTRFSRFTQLSATQRIELLQRLVSMQTSLGEDAGAVDSLTALVNLGHEPSELPLAEALERTGQWQRSADLYEAVLARNIGLVNVQSRLRRLRKLLGTPIQAQLPTETIAAPSAAKAGDRYQLVSELGRGGAGIVYAATDLELQRQVAIKLLHPHISNQARQVALFYQEARTTASLRHPNIIAVLDIVESSFALVMELAEGGTLRQQLVRGAFATRLALRRYTQLMSALAAAHRQGITHRDVKPRNLLYRRNPELAGAEIMLADFGIAHFDTDQKDAGRQAGSIAYMAPEQRRGESSEGKEDVFAAGLVLVEMLAGRLPENWRLHRPQWHDVKAMLQREVELDPELESPLFDLLQRSLAESPMLRPSAAEAVTEAKHLRDLSILKE